jgi:hypothetical protein
VVDERHLPLKVHRQIALKVTGVSCANSQRWPPRDAHVIRYINRRCRHQHAATMLTAHDTPHREGRKPMFRRCARNSGVETGELEVIDCRLFVWWCRSGGGSQATVEEGADQFER